VGLSESLSVVLWTVKHVLEVLPLSVSTNVISTARHAVSNAVHLLHSGCDSLIL